MRFRNTLILALLLLGLGAYLYFVESKQIAEEAKKAKLVDFNPDDVTALTLTYPDREIALEKSAGAWRLSKPLQTAADDITVKNLLRAVADAELKKTIDEPPQDLAPFGLAPPEVVVKIATKDTTLPDLKVGKTTSVSFSTYVQRGDQGKIYLTPSAFRSGMDKQVKDLRDKKIVDFKEDDITRVALRGPDGDVIVAKADGNWMIEQPTSLRADGNAVRTLLSTVRNMRATEFASDAPSDADLVNYGLQDPQRQLVLTAANGAETRVLVGKETDQGLYLKAGDRPTAFIVGKWASRDLSKGVNDLRDKTVLSFDPGAATAVDVTRSDGGLFTLQSKDGKWSLADSDQAVDDGAVMAYVGTLSHLSGAQVLGDATDLETYGLANPTLNIAVKGKDGVLIGAVRAGSRSGNTPPGTQYTIKREDNPTIFEIRDFQFKQLDKKPAEFIPAPPPPPGAAGLPIGGDEEGEGDAEE
jgi:hypothetical protein